MRFSSRLKLTTTISLLLTLIVGLTLFGSIRLATHATSPSPKPPSKLGNSSNKQSSNCGAWNVVLSPNASAYNLLYGVSAVSTTNAWAVGYTNTNSLSQTLIEHWDGGNWNVIPSPNPSNYNILYGVTAISANNIWAVGHYGNTTDDGIYQTLIEHWNGKMWQVVPSPNIGYSSSLGGVTAISKNNVWGVGLFFNSGSPQQTLITHWNGIKWNIVSSPSSVNSLNSVTRVPGSNQLWTVGVTSNSNYSYSLTLIEHWDGTSWSVVSSPNDGISNTLNGVAAISKNNVWAVGDSINNSSNFYQAMIEHWDETSWSVVSSPVVGTSYSYLEGVTRVSGTTQAWAVGYYNTDSGVQTLIEFYC